MDCSKCWWKVRYAGAAYCQHWAKAPRPLSRCRLFADEQAVVAKLQRDKRKRGNAAGLLAMLVAMAETGS